MRFLFQLLFFILIVSSFSAALMQTNRGRAINVAIQVESEYLDVITSRQQLQPPSTESSLLNDDRVESEGGQPAEAEADSDAELNTADSTSMFGSISQAVKQVTKLNDPCKVSHNGKVFHGKCSLSCNVDTPDLNQSERRQFLLSVGGYDCNTGGPNRMVEMVCCLKNPTEAIRLRQKDRDAAMYRMNEPVSYKVCSAKADGKLSATPCKSFQYCENATCKTPLRTDVLNANKRTKSRRARKWDSVECRSCLLKISNMQTGCATECGVPMHREDN